MVVAANIVMKNSTAVGSEYSSTLPAWKWKVFLKEFFQLGFIPFKPKIFNL